MTIPKEPIGSIARPRRLIEAVAASGDDADQRLDTLYEASTGGDTAFAKIRARVPGTAMAAQRVTGR